MILLLFSFTACQAPEQQSGWTGTTMGTTYQVKVAHVTLSDKDVALLKMEVDSVLVEVNRQMSTYDPGSEISRFNDYSGTDPYRVSADFVNVVNESKAVYRQSNGAFEITIAPLVNLWGFGKKGPRFTPPSDSEIDAELKRVGSDLLETVNGSFLQKKKASVQVDLSAIAKGFGVDKVAAYLDLKSFADYMVEIGGEVVARGKNAKNDSWKIGIDSPGFGNLPGQDLKAILALDNVAVATSGDYRNYFEYEGQIFSHTIDPRTGKPVTHHLASATIIAKNCMEADALATTVMVMGREKGLTLIESLPGIEAFLIERIGRDKFEIYQSSGFGKFLFQ